MKISVCRFWTEMDFKGGLREYCKLLKERARCSGLQEDCNDFEKLLDESYDYAHDYISPDE